MAEELSEQPALQEVALRGDVLRDGGVRGAEVVVAAVEERRRIRNSGHRFIDFSH